MADKYTTGSVTLDTRFQIHDQNTLHPIHLGPGAVFKAIGGRHFSFMVFGGAQVLMDIEPLVGMLRSWDVLHGPTHPLLGALVIGPAALAIGKPISAWVLRWLKIAHDPFTWRASFIGAYVGTFSHIVLDAVMHADMTPWWPLVAGGGLQGIISIDELHAVRALRFRKRGMV